ncbi:pirin family protein [Paenibacillus radicis (ex Gao et al. 2016)]|uniref:Quercetin 2,3-dioxygenase n=1 Tax=Paenibacillus radicis (ex Gao et al. 2016) TaxID=1737354 RepID=A0A917M2F9_9BACL|nr:pirin family protein [Paenibacillus radicis (ex Gao et al. 2016)]GGG73617.1 quercetin 2,3-dioxygenase [Paenibacillus radicis (ex Gao et al. 2016)]
MIKLFPANERNSVDLGWLRSARSFSFGDYFDQDNYGFGVMRVLNDDVIAPGRGFGAHPHSDMEIVTIPLAGRLKHEDNLGNVEVTSAGEVQRMTAGSGIIHAEYNDSDTEEGRFFQLWFMPREKGLEASYEMVSYDNDKLINAFVPIVTPDGANGTASIHQDLTIYLTRLEPGKKLYHNQQPGRRVFAMVIEGSVDINGFSMGPKDSIRAQFEPDILLRTSEESAFVLFIDLP